MANILDLITHLASEESKLPGTTFLAPCVSGGTVRTRVARMIYTFRRRPTSFEGWGIFTAIDAATARLAGEASPMQADAYLRLFPRFHLVLAFNCTGRSWLAYPANESDARQRHVRPEPVTVHLVEGAAAFESVLARWDGSAWWFEDIDRAADPAITAGMRAAFAGGADAEGLRINGLVPEMHTAYELAVSHVRDAGIRAHERRMHDTLERAGGHLREVHDRDDFWLVEWTTADGHPHSTAVAKSDLTVISAGICLSGRDREFDLQSLVGVMENRPEWMR